MALEEIGMIGWMRRGRDPWWDDGTGARATRRRRQIESFSAFALAIGACGLTTAVWLRVIAPAVTRALGI
jgi:hypothetical protein